LAQRPDPPDAIEGAFLYRHGDWYYLFVSFDFCCKGLQSTYNIRVGRSKNFTGPYTDREGIAMLRGGGTLVKGKGSRDIGPGHNSILVDGSQEYLVYHAYDVQVAGMSRLRIQQLTWDAQGWPVAP
jgi:arabinan endo-1,5-alpha-L-arabinosidase